MATILYGFSTTTYVRTARLALEEKGVDYVLEGPDFKSEEYRHIHPFNRVPALEHQGKILFETLAITWFVDEQFDGPPLQPDKLMERAEMFQWISAINDYVFEPMVVQCIIERLVKPLRGLPTDEDAIHKAKPEIARQLDVFQNVLGNRDFLVGDRLTLADLFLVPIISYLAATPEGQELLPHHGAVMDWHDRIAERPSFRKCCP